MLSRRFMPPEYESTRSSRRSERSVSSRASAMAKKNAGDWVDPDQVRAWTRRIASELRPPAKAAPTPAKAA